MNGKKYKELLVSVCVREILSTCCCCYSTVVNARMHQKLATILADCHLSAFGDFFLQCLFFILVVLCRCIRDPDA